MEQPLKTQLHLQCVNKVDQRISELKHILKEAQQAANNETKSSAGDKHETARAMAQLETEKLSAQLTDALKLKQSLDVINPKNNHPQIGSGSLVFTNRTIFYLAVSLGKINVENQDYFVISSVSPIGQQLLSKKEKDSFTFNGVEYVIEKVV